jgi:hypothetical protein
MRTFLVVCGWLLAALAGAQEPLKEPLQVTFAYDAKSAAKELQNLAVRPNVTQPVYFYLTNKSPALIKDITFRLVQVYPGGRVVEIVRGSVKKIAAEETEAVVFDKLKSPPKDDASWPMLAGPPFKFSLIIDSFQGVEKTTRHGPFDFYVTSPTEYVAVENPNYDAGTKRLSFRVKLKEGFKDLNPPCPVELVLDPMLVPGLIPSKSGAFLQELDKDNPSVELAAENIAFDGKSLKEGRVTISVDGYQRAFLFRWTFADGTLNELEVKNRARILAPRYTPGQEYLQVPLQIDVADPKGKTVELGFNKAGASDFVVTSYPGPREEIIRYNVADDGTLLFRSQVSDWLAKVKTKAVYGAREFRVQIKQGPNFATLENETSELPLLFDEGPGNRFGPLKIGDANRAVFSSFVIDPTPPELVQFDAVPDKIVGGVKFRPTLTIKPRAVDRAPIDKVVFFLGQPDKDDKIPPTAPLIPGAWDVSEGVWIATQELLVPSDQKDKIVLSAQATTAAGISATLSRSYLLYSVAEEKKSKIEFVKITGLVMHGDLAQQKVKLALFNLKDLKAEPKRTETDTAGKYEFTKVPPGPHFLIAEKTPYNLISRIQVDVPDDKEAISVPLKLRAK